MTNATDTIRSKFHQQFKRARRVGTPLVAIETPDPAAVIALLATTNGTTPPPMIVWDVVRGWRGVNDAGREAVIVALEGADPDATINPTECLIFARKLPERSVLFLMGAHRFFDADSRNVPNVQALWNLRDEFKATLRTAVLLGPSFTLPAELSGDVMVLDEPLPDDDELRAIVADIAEAAEVDGGNPEDAIDALRGLSGFAAEQATAMSVTKEGIDIEALWSRKKDMIGATPGLSVWNGGERFEDIGGNANIIEYCRRILAGREAPRCVVFVDEIEKSLAGATGGDTSGVSQGQLQVLLTYMQDREASGMIFVGPPGAGKSAVAKAVGNEGHVPTIALDLGGMKASLVGESEARLRNAMKVIDAIGGGRALFVATCNKIASLPPELRRRFTLGTYFFDLPDADEREVIWSIYRKRYGIEDDTRPNDENWTGAEIKQACSIAYRIGVPLQDTAAYIVPVARSAAEQIATLRREADRRFLSASHPGLFESAPEAAPTTGGKRRVAVAD